jgi:hypothetical protein
LDEVVNLPNALKLFWEQVPGGGPKAALHQFGHIVKPGDRVAEAIEKEEARKEES